MRAKLFLLMPLLLIVLYGCGVFAAKPQAEALVERYFRAVKSGDFQEVLPLFSEEFFKKTPKTEVVRELARNRREMGTLGEYRQVSCKIEVNSGQGWTIVTLLYQVKYSEGEAQETFAVKKPFDQGPAAISAHKISLESWNRYPGTAI